MTKEEAISFVGRYSPCPHDNAETRLGDGKTWARCEDCGHEFRQANWAKSRAAAEKFAQAIEALRA
jgi:hypothetical protein